MRERVIERYILSTLPTLYIPFYKKDGGKFLSSDGHGFVCTATGALWTMHGRNFVNAADRIVVPTNAAFANMFDGGGTALFWVYPHSDGGSDAGVVFTPTAITNSYSLNVQSDNGTAVALRFYYLFDGDDGIWITDNRVLTLNVWSCEGST